jgi:hypothetical protein
MTSFPPPSWEARLIDDFESFTVAPRPDGKLAVTTLMAVRYKKNTYIIYLAQQNAIKICRIGWNVF